MSGRLCQIVLLYCLSLLCRIFFFRMRKSKFFKMSLSISHTILMSYHSLSLSGVCVCVCVCVCVRACVRATTCVCVCVSHHLSLSYFLKMSLSPLSDFLLLWKSADACRLCFDLVCLHVWSTYWRFKSEWDFRYGLTGQSDGYELSGTYTGHKREYSPQEYRFTVRLFICFATGMFGLRLKTGRGLPATCLHTLKTVSYTHLTLPTKIGV